MTTLHLGDRDCILQHRKEQHRHRCSRRWRGRTACLLVRGVAFVDREGFTEKETPYDTTAAGY
jgi:hypothetical protein